MIDRREFLTAVGAGVWASSGRRAVRAEEAETPAKERYRVIDTHLHLFNSDLQGQNGIPRVVTLDATVERAVAAMKQGGVDQAFLITYNAQDIARQFQQRGQDPAMLRLVFNTTYQIAAWKKHPELFHWFPDHIDPLRETYLEDLEKNFDDGAAGIKLLPIFHGLLPDHPGFIPVYEMCRKRKKPVILDLSWWYFEFMPPHFEAPPRREMVKRFADYAKLLDPLFREFSDVPFSLAHCGTAKTLDDYPDIFALIADHPNISCDVAAATGYSAEFLQRLVKAVGAERVMYGSDWPYWASGPESYLKGSRRWTMITEECPSLTDAEKRLILAGNAERFLKFELPAAGSKDKKPDSEISVRARTLHRESVVIVIHDHNPIAPDVESMLTGGVTGKVYQLMVDVDIGRDFREHLDKRDGWTKKGLAAIEDVHRAIDADPDRLLLATTAGDFLKAKQDGKAAILIGVEGAKLLEGRLETLTMFYERGLRELQLRWAVPNQVVEEQNLTPFGVQLVRECQRLGIIVDVTHIPTPAFDEVVELMEKPFIVSHGTAAGATADLEDRKLRALASRSGVLGLHFYSSYLGEKPTVERVVRNVDYIADLVGIDTVGLGVDFFPTSGKWQEFQQAQGTKDISWAVSDIGQLQQVTEALVRRNYSDEDIKKVLGGNFLRVCHDVFGA